MWKEINCITRSFKYEGEPELIHIIETGFKNRYMVVFEDAYELVLGNVEFHTKEEIEQLFKIKL